MKNFKITSLRNNASMETCKLQCEIWNTWKHLENLKVTETSQTTVTLLKYSKMMFLVLDQVYY
jgi:hypothetical protein